MRGEPVPLRMTSELASRCAQVGARATRQRLMMLATVGASAAFLVGRGEDLGSSGVFLCVIGGIGLILRLYDFSVGRSVDLGAGTIRLKARRFDLSRNPVEMDYVWLCVGEDRVAIAHSARERATMACRPDEVHLNRWAIGDGGGWQLCELLLTPAEGVSSACGIALRPRAARTLSAAMGLGLVP